MGMLVCEKGWRDMDDPAIDKALFEAIAALGEVLPKYDDLKSEGYYTAKELAEIALCCRTTMKTRLVAGKKAKTWEIKKAMKGRVRCEMWRPVNRS